MDERGKVTATLQAPELIKSHLQIDSQGRLHALVQKVLEIDPGWHFPTSVEIAAQTITPDGKLATEQPVYTGDTASLPPDWEAGFATAPDGKRGLASRAGALFAGPTGADPAGGGPWQVYRDIERAHWRFSLLYPRHAVGSTFSPDGRFVLFTMDSRPPFGGLGTPSYPPTASETVLWDIETGKPVWRLADTSDYMRSPYAVHSGFAAVASGGKLTALAGYGGSIYLLDAAGKPLVQQAILRPRPRLWQQGVFGPIDGVGVAMSDGGELAAFAFKNLLVLAAGDKLARVELPRVAGMAVLADGSAAVVALSTGELRAFDAAGQTQWMANPGGAGTVIAAAGKNRLLAAGGAGELVMLDGAGQEVWRTAVAAAADKTVHPLEPGTKFVRLPPPADYVEPETLALAKQEIGAKEITRWTPSGQTSGPASEAWGRKFYALSGKIELASGPVENSFVHLVYRRPVENKSLSVVVTDAGGKNEFLLDLPTPTYRAIDIPLAGKGARIVVAGEGPIDVAECSLWSFAWPGPNLCYVKPAGATADTKTPGEIGSRLGRHRRLARRFGRRVRRSAGRRRRGEDLQDLLCQLRRRSRGRHVPAGAARPDANCRRPSLRRGQAAGLGAVEQRVLSHPGCILHDRLRQDVADRPGGHVRPLAQAIASGAADRHLHDRRNSTTVTSGKDPGRRHAERSVLQRLFSARQSQARRLPGVHIYNGGMANRPG